MSFKTCDRKKNKKKRNKTNRDWESERLYFSKRIYYLFIKLMKTYYLKDFNEESFIDINKWLDEL